MPNRSERDLSSLLNEVDKSKNTNREKKLYKDKVELKHGVLFDVANEYLSRFPVVSSKEDDGSGAWYTKRYHATPELLFRNDKATATFRLRGIVSNSKEIDEIIVEQVESGIDLKERLLFRIGKDYFDTWENSRPYQKESNFVGYRALEDIQVAQDIIDSFVETIKP